MLMHMIVPYISKRMKNGSTNTAKDSERKNLNNFLLPENVNPPDALMIFLTRMHLTGRSDLSDPQLKMYATRSLVVNEHQNAYFLGWLY